MVHLSSPKKPSLAMLLLAKSAFNSYIINTFLGSIFATFMGYKSNPDDKIFYRVFPVFFT